VIVGLMCLGWLTGVAVGDSGDSGSNVSGLFTSDCSTAHLGCCGRQW